MNFEKIEETIFDQVFWNYFNNECVFLEKDEEYKSYGEICSNIINNNPKIQLVIENEKANELSKEDVEKLIKYIKFHSKRDLMENKRVFYAGAKFMFQLFNEINIFDKKSNSDSSENQVAIFVKEDNIK